MPVRDANGVKIANGDTVRRASRTPGGTMTVKEIGRKGSMNEGRVRTAVSHWEGGRLLVVDLDERTRRLVRRNVR